MNLESTFFLWNCNNTEIIIYQIDVSFLIFLCCLFGKNKDKGEHVEKLFDLEG